MAPATEKSLRFIPSRVDGLASVTEVVVFPDRLELLSASEWVVVRFLDIGRWHKLGWLWRPVARLGWVCAYPCVADRDWFHSPSARFFRFFTQPPMTVYMSEESSDLGYAQTMFRRVQEVIAAGGFATFDLG